MPWKIFCDEKFPLCMFCVDEVVFSNDVEFRFDDGEFFKKQFSSNLSETRQENIKFHVTFAMNSSHNV